jgi:hypothetical protein
MILWINLRIALRARTANKLRSRKRHRMPRPVVGEECESSSGSVAKQRC